MGRYYTSGVCLDCQLELDELTVCPRCGLAQTGLDADRLRWLLGQADVALGIVRSADPRSVAAAPAVASTPPAPSGPQTPPTAPPGWAALRSPSSLWEELGPMPAPRRPAAAAHTWPALSTPAVLLGLGGISVLVAAVVFVSVAWSDLSLGAKAAILLTVTAAIGAVGVWSARRGLRGSAETFSCLFAVMAVLDLMAAVHGSLFGLGELDGRPAEWLSATLLVGTGLAWARSAIASRTRKLTGVQLLAAGGMLWFIGLVAEENLARGEYVAFALTAALLGVAAVAARCAIWTFAVCVVALAASTLVAAYAISLQRIVMETTLAGLWSDGTAVGWVLCLLLAAGVARVSRLRMGVRNAAAAIASAGAALLVLRPLDGSSFDQILVCLAATCLGAAAATLVLPRPWRAGALTTSVPTGLNTAAMVAPSVLVAVGALLIPALEPWQHSAVYEADYVVDFSTDIGTPWLVGVSASAVLAAAFVVARRRLPGPEPVLLIVSSSAACAALRYPMPLWSVVAIMGGLAVVAAGAALAFRSPVSGVLSGVYASLCLIASLGSQTTTLAAAIAIAVALAVLAWRVSDVIGSAVAAAGSELLVGLATAAALDRADLSDSVTSYALVGLGVVGVVAAQVRPHGACLRARLGIETAALALICVGIALGVEFDLALQAPICLTVAGAGLIAVSLLSADRRLVSVAGGVLLASASWVRLAAEDVTTVEAYTLPTALVLVVLGSIRMLRTPGASSIASLGGGLSLALLPSLGVAVSEPTSLRALLLGIVAVAVLLVGAVLRWIAPLLAGGFVIVVLAVVNLAPYADAVPRWVLFALLGAVLLFLGITWEKRLRNARTLVAAAERLA
jgi:hypothetical protein